MAPVSHRVTSVLGSSMAEAGSVGFFHDNCRDLPGTRPLGLMSVKGLDFTSWNGKELISYGTPSSSRMRTTFHGLGPGADNVR
jgi:hypothetical protein